MPGEYFSVFLATLYFLRPTLGEFTDLVCEPSQRATSQFEDSDRETTNISSENLLDGFARFAHVLEEQTPGHIFNFIETPREIGTHTLEATRELLYNSPPPQFTRGHSHPNYGLQKEGLVWNGGPHVIGELSVNLTGEFDMLGELEYSQQGIFVPPSPLGGGLTEIAHVTGELAEPTKVRRFLKLVKRAACLTPTDISCPGQNFCCKPTATCAVGSCTLSVAGCLTPTDHLCPGGSFCCAPTATCAGAGCTVSPVAPTCLTPGDRLCPGYNFCCKPTATCISAGCTVQPTCVDPGYHSCEGATFCCPPTATCAGPVGYPTGCTGPTTCVTPTDHICPGSSFCCPPTATCVSNGCSVSSTTPRTCLTSTDHLCPGSSFCCAPTATCVSDGCTANPCLTPTDHICPGSSFCCPPTATCVSTGCTVSVPCSLGQVTCSGRNFCCPSGATCLATACQGPPTCTGAGYTLCTINTSWCCPAGTPCIATGTSVVCGSTPATPPLHSTTMQPSPTIVSLPPTPSTTAPPPPPPPTTPVISPATTPTPNTNAAAFSSIASNLFPPGNGAIVTSVAKALCSQFAIPEINSVIANQESRGRGVANLIQNCVKLFNSAEPPPGGSNPQVVFNLALGNIALCDKLTNTILEGTLVQGQSDFCNGVLSS